MLKLNHLDYYRLPWNLTDNIIHWLEPTAKCNLYCEGCYRLNEKDGHKSMEQVREDLDVFQLQVIHTLVQLFQGRSTAIDSDHLARGSPLLCDGQSKETYTTANICARLPTQAAHQTKEIVYVLEGLSLGGFKFGQVTSTDHQYANLKTIR